MPELPKGVGEAEIKYYNTDGEEVTPKNVGAYTIVLTLKEGRAYTAAHKNMGLFIINPAEVTVAPKDTEKIYGEEDPTLEYTAEGVVEGETLQDIEVTRVQGENVGTYKMTAGIKEGKEVYIYKFAR